MRPTSLLRNGLLALPLLLGPVAGAQANLNLSDLQSMKLGPSPALVPGLGSSLEMPSSATTDQTGLFEPVDDSVYVLGPGDNLSVGLGSKVVSTTVNPEGLVVLENTGPIPVGDLTLRDARKVIIARVAKAYKEEKLFVTLNKAKRIKASIIGAVATPGMYEIEATARLTDILQRAGGFAPNANRKVTIRKRKGEAPTFDLNAYFSANDLSQNPYLGAGDQIRLEEVDPDGPTVRISENEQINLVQLKPGQNAYDLIAEYFAFRKPRNWDYIKVYRKDSSAVIVDKRQSRTFIPEPGANLELRSYKPLVFVSGAVARPMSLDFNANYNALDYIAASGILPITGDYHRLLVISSTGEQRMVDSSRDRIFPGDHIFVKQSKESLMRDYLGVLASIAGIFSSIALTIVTIYSL
jgi:protein involved in polysaccharide export with SLBB domain